MNRIAALIASVTFCFVAHADEQPLHTSLGTGRPIAELPAHVRAAEGKLSLFADFEDVRGENIVLYLVNKTGKRHEMNAQDRDIYVKLEAKVMQNLWERAQTHTYSWCGNSYFPVVVAPKSFHVFLGHYPSEGEPRDVRYVSYKNEHLVSNIGRGRVRPAEMKQAKYDRMAIETGDFDFVSQVALRKHVAEPLAGYWKNSRQIAVYSLRRFPRVQAAPVLNQLLDDEDEHVRQAANSVLNSLDG